jgi:methylthioribose-1-phosphate isomerase
LPSTTIDWSLDSGARIPIEERSQTEVTQIAGRLADGTIAAVEITPSTSPAANPAFDVTPARLVSGFITERGVCAASEAGLRSLFPEGAGSSAE